MKKWNVITSLLLSAICCFLPMKAYVREKESVIFVSANDGEDATEELAMKEEMVSMPAEKEEVIEENIETEDALFEEQEEVIPCICTDLCSAYENNTECNLCKEDYERCEYTTPEVVIEISEPDGWYRSGKAEVTIQVEDILQSGNFELAKVEARIGSSGSFSDITETMRICISENCSVYVQVTDTKGKIYSKNRGIQCFDQDKPTLNAGISSGILMVQAMDTTSGIQAVYVNGQKFTELTNDTVRIRLQQFDSAYENFTIQAMDGAGNGSDIYAIKNPYYKNPAAEENRENTIPDLPESALPTNQAEATATVTDYTNTAEDGESERKEFYTIQTEDEKVFYLVIDHTKNSNQVYFLTEISENDLLHVTGTDYRVMAQNAAVVESELSNEDSSQEPETEEEVQKESEERETETEEPIEERDRLKEGNAVAASLFLGMIGMIAVVILYFFKIYRKKGEDFVDEEEEGEEEEIYEKDEDESEENFLDQEEEGE